MIELAWVIERGDSEVSKPLYLAPMINSGWSFDHNEAIRFARRQDAESVADSMGLHGDRICEHSWG